LKYILSFRTFEQLALALKNRAAQKFSLYGIYFSYLEFLSNLLLPWKNRVALEYLTVLNMYFLSLRIFEQLVLALKKQNCPEIFHCIEYTFYIQEF